MNDQPPLAGNSSWLCTGCLFWDMVDQLHRGTNFHRGPVRPGLNGDRPRS